MIILTFRDNEKFQKTKGDFILMDETKTIPKRPLGKTGAMVTILGLGGEGLLRSYNREEEAVPLIHRAIEMGITYFESARFYSGSENYYGMALQERRKDIFLTSKSHERTGNGALKHLETTLKNMKTEFLDLWIIHDIRTPKDLEIIFSPKGAIRAFESAKRNKLVRFIGISGHRNPTIISRALDLFPFDVVLIPVNPGEPHYWSFIDEVLPKAEKQGMGILGMKALSRGISVKIFGVESVEDFLRFALTQNVTAVVVGCETIEQLEMNVKITKSFKPMTQHEQELIISKVKPYARELMYYKL